MQARQLNPSETSAFKADMGTLPPEHQADVALKWRERCVNALTTFVPTPIQEGMQFISAGLYTTAIGAWDGANDAERTAHIRQWKTDTAVRLGVNLDEYPTPFRDVIDKTTGETIHKAIPDPRSWYGVNKTVVPTAVLALSSIGLAATGRGQAVNPYLKAGALAGGGYLVGSAFRDLAYERRAKALEAGAAIAPPNGEANGQEEGGPVGNPCGGYPRAVA